MATVQIPEAPDNSYKMRLQKKPEGENSEKPQEKNLQKVISGKVITKKKSVWVRMKERFFANESMDLKEYFVDEVFIPGIKNLLGGIVDGVGNGIMDSFNMAIFGTAARRRTSFDRGRYTNYGSYYNGGRSRRDDARSAVNPRSKKTFDDVILETRKDADDILRILFDVLERYGRVSVADLNELIGVTGQYTDNYWGWDNLESADIKRVREGYLLLLPDVISLKD